MSENPSAEPSEGPPQKESHGNLLGGRDAGAKPLTPQQLREQRLARLGGSGSPVHKQQMKKPPPSSPKNVSRTKNSIPEDKIMKSQSQSVPNEPSPSTKTPSKPRTTKTPPAAPPSSPIQNATPVAVNDDNSKETNAPTRKNTPNETTNEKTSDLNDQGYLAGQEAKDLEAEEDQDSEDEDLQAAIALSMEPSPTASAQVSDSLGLEPLPLSECFREGESYSNEIGSDLLATAAMVVATNPELAATPPSTAPSTPMQVEVEDEDEDPFDNDVMMQEEIASPASVPISPSRIPRSDPQHFSGRVRTWYRTATPFNVLDFHDCMWDKGVTTENDQKRWLAQGITFKAEHDDPNTFSTRTAAGTLTAADERTDTSSMLAAIISGPGVWCLTQEHGGPCGVLASIQAELLVILLFGPRTVHPLSMISIDFPTSLSTEFTRAAPDMSRSKMRQALALSMGIILARASLVASAALEDDTNTESASNDNIENNENDNDPIFVARPEPTVTLILPKNELWDTTSCLEWRHLEPWNSNNGGGGLSEHLLEYQISLNKNPSTGDDGDAKRQKHICDIDIDHSCRELAHATAQFLLETNSLNWFQRPGGVLLMVMSVAASRGIPKLQGDMDILTSKLTTNYGYCSQELINLVLTGQAVSNVFDHTLRPSGELVCRGIQSQPAIGYLTQLEAKRFVEVGAFYKTPRFPVWVIGSVSHFTVMFGDGSALTESASDVLLEKVRRAFKRMDGGAEENGFIKAAQLGEFLKSVDLKRITEHEVQMLAAYMDRFGGIILWEDLWKRTSRLLTGASIESILDGTDEANNDNVNINDAVISSVDANEAPAAAAAEDTPLSDEELARKLHAEWNADTSLANTTSNSTGTRSRIAQKEKFGRTFQLYHYNGLHGGNFKAFRVTRLSADEAIGASISLGGSGHTTHRFGEDLDSVLRTKWPGCKINWLGGSAPSIN
eukprot:jgi/Psemu1/323174/estExt_fgenesh1_pg.C_590023